MWMYPNDDETSITINQETYIFNKTKSRFLFIDGNGDVEDKLIESKTDFMRLYTDHISNFYNVGCTMPVELEKWFEDTFKDIGGDL